MSYVINLYVSDIKSINRTVVVNDNISIQLFVKSLILSMNGSTRNLYLLEKSRDVVEFDDSDDLSMLNLKVGDIYTIEYNYDDKLWNLEFVVLEKNEGFNIKKIEILDGQGYGICQSEDMLFIKELIYTKNKKWRENILDYYKTLNKYFNLKFLLDEVSKLIDDYGKLYEEMYSPKSIVMNVSLNGFDKEIKRKIIVNNNILIDKFCRAVIVSMQGEIDHLYTVKFNKRLSDENILDEKLSYLELSVGSKFKVIYDYGDNWQFNVRVSKVNSGFHDKEFEILSGLGYGIVEDCGGVNGLNAVFSGESCSFDPYDINEFNLDELQKYVDKQLRVDNLHQERSEYY